MQPDVRYVKSGAAAIAYQVVGEGETDLVYIPLAALRPRRIWLAHPAELRDLS